MASLKLWLALTVGCCVLVGMAESCAVKLTFEEHGRKKESLEKQLEKAKEVLEEACEDEEEGGWCFRYNDKLIGYRYEADIKGCRKGLKKILKNDELDKLEDTLEKVKKMCDRYDYSKEHFFNNRGISCKPSTASMVFGHRSATLSVIAIFVFACRLFL